MISIFKKCQTIFQTVLLFLVISSNLLGDLLLHIPANTIVCHFILDIVFICFVFNYNKHILCGYWPIYMFFGRTNIQIICPSYNWDFVFLLNLQQYIFWIYYEIHDLLIFSLVLYVVFHFLDGDLEAQTILIWMKLDFSFFFVLGCV